MEKILFTHSYFLKLDPKQWKQQHPYAPLGTITAAALMREKGYQVSLHDTMFCESPDEIKGTIIKNKPEYLVIYDDGFNYLTKMCLTNMRNAAFRMIEIGKQYGCTVIISSSDATDHTVEYLEKGADYIIIGEGELTLSELIHSLENGTQNQAEIPGLVFKGKSELIRTFSRPVLQNIDSLPMAAWDLVDLKMYKSKWVDKYGYFSVNMATTRGCPYKCNWCAKPIYGNRYNTRSPENVVKELVYLKEAIGFEHVWFCDDIFGLKPGWVEEFSSLMKHNNLIFKYKIQSRADLLQKGNVLNQLSESGCDTIWMGVESGSQKILDAMDKGISIKQVYETTSRIKALKMKPAFFLQFGYLGETRKDIQLTIDMLMDLMPHDIGISVSYPLPGTVFYEIVKHELVTKSNWTDSDDLAMMFQNTYHPTYYRRLHKMVHKKFRRRQAINTFKDLFSKRIKPEKYHIYKAATALYYIPAEAFAAFRLKMTNI